MTKLIKQIAQRATANSSNGNVECNYSNNYYGDQVCKPVATPSS